LRVVGRRDRLAPGIIDAIEWAEQETRGGERLHLRLAVDYSSRYALVEALKRAATLQGLAADRPDLAAELGRAMHAEGPSPDVDLLIRTGGEQRLSDFLLWECAYAELLFTPKMWPDFEGEDLAAAMRDFASRERRFGNVQMAG
jgi:undecaprenyl diphosphate synthase